MIFSEGAEFVKEFKKLAKKYRSLKQDLEEFKKLVSKIPLGTSKHFTVLKKQKTIKVIKARFFCRYLRGTSLRLTYAYHQKNEKINFIEIYFKGNKENGDILRVNNYLKSYEND